MTQLVLTLKRVNVHTARIFEALVRTILSLLLLGLTAAMGRAVFTVIANVFATTSDLHHLLTAHIVDALTILAVLEVYKTAQAYFTAGRVKVTYTLDTVLVVLLTEVIVFWFQEAGWARLAGMVSLILTLVVARILAIRYSPGA